MKLGIHWVGLIVLLARSSLGEGQAISDSGQTNSTLPKLTKLAQIIALPPSEAARQYPVEFGATVTFSDPDWGLLFVQDDTAGIFVNRLTPRETAGLGVRFHATGVTGRGLYSPILLWAEISQAGKGSLPVPRRTDIHELN